MNQHEQEIKSIEAEQRKLADRLAEVKRKMSEPESVKAEVISYHRECHNVYMTPESLCVKFDTKEQAQKAKTIIEKMEFADPPQKGKPVQRLDTGLWYDYGDFTACEWETAMWHGGVLRVK